MWAFNLFLVKASVVYCLWAIKRASSIKPRSRTVLKAMPHGSEKSPEKNRNEIRHSLCMPHGRGKIVANYEENDT